jgi:hypothetical protein
VQGPGLEVRDGQQSVVWCGPQVAFVGGRGVGVGIGRRDMMFWARARERRGKKRRMVVVVVVVVVGRILGGFWLVRLVEGMLVG